MTVIDGRSHKSFSLLLWLRVLQVSVRSWPKLWLWMVRALPVLLLWPLMQAETVAQAHTLLPIPLPLSPLVKTALFASQTLTGGRILAAVGRAPVDNLECGHKCSIWLDDVLDC